MLKWRPANVTDVTRVKLRPEMAPYEDLPSAIEEFYKYPGFAVSDESGQTLAYFGIERPVPTVAYFWARVSEAVMDRPLEFHRLVKRNMEAWVQEHGVGVAHMVVDVDFSRANRWAESLGFFRGGTVSKYNDEHEYFLYTRYF